MNIMSRHLHIFHRFKQPKYPALSVSKCLMKNVKALLFGLCSTLLIACATPREPLPEPYVAVKGKPYYWEINGDHVFNCFIIGATKGHGYKIKNDPCRFMHDGNFSEIDLKGVGFYLDGSVIVESAVPLFGPFGPMSSYDKRITFPIVIQVVEPNDPMLQKRCSRVDYSQLDTDYDYPKNTVAYDCSPNRR